MACTDCKKVKLLVEQKQEAKKIYTIALEEIVKKYDGQFKSAVSLSVRLLKKDLIDNGQFSKSIEKVSKINSALDKNIAKDKKLAENIAKRLTYKKPKKAEDKLEEAIIKSIQVAEAQAAASRAICHGYLPWYALNFSETIVRATERNYEKLKIDVAKAPGAPALPMPQDAGTQVTYEQTEHEKSLIRELWGRVADKPVKKLTRDDTHIILDLVGVVDPFGIADGYNAYLYAEEGDVLSCAVSLVGVAIPYVGDVAKLMLRGGGRSVSMIIRLIKSHRKKIAPILRKLKKRFKDNPAVIKTFEKVEELLAKDGDELAKSVKELSGKTIPQPKAKVSGYLKNYIKKKGLQAMDPVTVGTQVAVYSLLTYTDMGQEIMKSGLDYVIHDLLNIQQPEDILKITNDLTNKGHNKLAEISFNLYKQLTQMQPGGSQSLKEVRLKVPKVDMKKFLSRPAKSLAVELPDIVNFKTTLRNLKQSRFNPLKQKNLKKLVSDVKNHIKVKKESLETIDERIESLGNNRLKIASKNPGDVALDQIDANLKFLTKRKEVVKAEIEEAQAILKEASSLVKVKVKPKAPKKVARASLMSALDGYKRYIVLPFACGVAGVAASAVGAFTAAGKLVGIDFKILAAMASLITQFYSQIKAAEIGAAKATGQAAGQKFKKFFTEKGAIKRITKVAAKVTATYLMCEKSFLAGVGASMDTGLQLVQSDWNKMVDDIFVTEEDRQTAYLKTVFDNFGESAFVALTPLTIIKALPADATKQIDKSTFVWLNNNFTVGNAIRTALAGLQDVIDAARGKDNKTYRTLENLKNLIPKEIINVITGVYEKYKGLYKTASNDIKEFGVEKFIACELESKSPKSFKYIFNQIRKRREGINELLELLDNVESLNDKNKFLINFIKLVLEAKDYESFTGDCKNRPKIRTGRTPAEPPAAKPPAASPTGPAAQGEEKDPYAGVPNF
jgi:hypothetical protein